MFQFKIFLRDGVNTMKNITQFLFLAGMIACSSGVISASSPACSSSSSSQSSDQQSLTHQLKDDLALIKNSTYQVYDKAIALVKAGADVNNVIDQEGTTPLMFVAQQPNIPGRCFLRREYFCTLIRAGADRGLRDISGKTVHDYADYDFKQIMEKIELVHAIAQRAQYPDAIKNFHTEHAHMFPDNESEVFDFDPLVGIDPINYPIDHCGSTALMEAARWNQIEDVRLLLNAGADASLCNNHRTTALHIVACEDQSISSMQLLIDHGAKMDVRDVFGNNVLRVAVTNGNIPGFELLMASGSRFDQMEKIFMTNYEEKKAPLLVYYLMACKPVRKKYSSDNEFQDALAAWNKEFRDAKAVSRHDPIKTLMDNAHAIESNLSPEQLSRCNAVMAQRSRIMGGGNIMQLLRQREQYNTNPLLLKRRLTHRISTMPEPLENEGDIIYAQSTANADQ